MGTPSRGRPHASSREELADAACELFLERGYGSTSIADIARRAGVSRASFFNYFSSKSDLLWDVFDIRLGALEARLAESRVSLGEALDGFADGEAPETLALAIVDARTMGLEEELLSARAERQSRIARAICERLMRDRGERLASEVRGAGYAAALVGAVWMWADLGAGRHSLAEEIRAALAEAHDILS